MLAPMRDVREGSDVPRDSSSTSSTKHQARAEEATLVARCQSGDMEAFEAIYRRHSSAMYNLAFCMVGNLTEAEDLLQEIFLQAYKKLPSYEGRAAFGTWLYRLAVNRCLDHLRSGAAHRQSVTKSLDESAGFSPSATPESTSARLDLENAIVQLPHSYRSAFLLYDVQGFGHREVADILGVAEGTSKSLVHKATLKLRELLGKSQREKSGE